MKPGLLTTYCGIGHKQLQKRHYVNGSHPEVSSAHLAILPVDAALDGIVEYVSAQDIDVTEKANLSEMGFAFTKPSSQSGRF